VPGFASQMRSQLARSLLLLIAALSLANGLTFVVKPGGSSCYMQDLEVNLLSLFEPLIIFSPFSSLVIDALATSK